MRGIDADLPEQVGHAEGAGFVGNDGHDARTHGGVFQQRGEHAHDGHRGRHFLAVCGQGETRPLVCVRRREPRGLGVAARNIAAQRGAARLQVAQLGAVVGGPVELERQAVGVGNRQREAVAEGEQRLVVQLLLLVGGHLALAGRPHAKPLLGLREDDGGLAAMARGAVVSAVDLHHVVAAPAQAVDGFVRPVGHQCSQFGILVEEMGAVEGAVVGREGLELAVHGVGEGACQRAARVSAQQGVPVAAPDQLDDVPAGTRIQGFQLVDDAAVATHRAVQALQVAVDDEDQVVELFARGQRERGDGFGLVHFTVAENAPHLAVGAGHEGAVLQVAHEARLVDRVDGADTHRTRGELPEVGHQPRVGIGRQAPQAARGGRDFLAEVRQVIFAQKAFQEGARVHAGRRVRLHVDDVAGIAVRPRPEEMVEADLEQVGGRCIAGDVAAQLAMRLVGAYHHRQRVPAVDAGNAFFDGQIAGEGRFLVGGNGVQVCGAGLAVGAQAERGGMTQHAVQHIAGTIGPVRLQQGLQRFAPFGGFCGVGVVLAGRCGKRLARVEHGKSSPVFILILDPCARHEASKFPGKSGAFSIIFRQGPAPRQVLPPHRAYGW